jgi:hypothetical protein
MCSFQSGPSLEWPRYDRDDNQPPSTAAAMVIENNSNGLSGVLVSDRPPTYHIDELPEQYGRLLAEYIELLKRSEVHAFQSFPKALLFMFRPDLWTHPIVRDFGRIPDAVRQELPHTGEILKSVATLNDVQFRGLAHYSGLNVTKLTNRIVLGSANKALVSFAAALTAAKGLKEVLGVDLAVYVPSSVPIVGGLIGLATGLAANAVVSFLTLSHRLRLVRALDDIISIVAAKNLKK